MNYSGEISGAVDRMRGFLLDHRGPASEQAYLRGVYLQILEKERSLGVPSENSELYLERLGNLCHVCNASCSSTRDQHAIRVSFLGNAEQHTLVTRVEFGRLCDEHKLIQKDATYSASGEMVVCPRK